MDVRNIMLVALLGFPLNMVHSQSEQMVSQSEPNTGPEAETADENNSALARLTHVTSVENFLDLLEDENGNPVTQDTLWSQYESEAGTDRIRGGGRMAVPDECSPRNVTVKLEMPDDDANAVFFPQCTRMERCGGCCSSRYLECVPAYTERVALKVIKATAPFPGSPHLRYSGFSTVIVERHVRCEVKCTLSAAKCGEKKRYIRSLCDCRCRRFKRCRVPVIWNPETCECECPNGPQECCPPGINCGLIWDKTECRCAIGFGNRDFIEAGAGNDSSILEWIMRRNMTEGFAMLLGDTAPSNPPPTTTSSTTTPSTTSTATTTTMLTTPTTSTTPNPCARQRRVYCPGGCQKVVTSTGRCACRCTRIRQGGRRGRVRG